MSNLDVLKAQRQTLVARVANLRSAGLKLSSLRQGVAEAEQALREHDADVSDALAAWARNGAEGDAPVGDPQVRADLLRSLARAQASVAQAGTAQAALDAETSDVNLELARIEGHVAEAALDVLEARHAGEIEGYLAFVNGDVLPKLKRVLGYHKLLLRLADEAATGEAKRLILTRAANVAEKIGDLPGFRAELQATPNDVAGAGAAWIAELATLIAGAPATNVVSIGEAA